MSNPPFNLKFLANRIDISGSLHTKGRTTVDESLIVRQAVHARSLRITNGSIIGDNNLSVGGKSTFNGDVSMNGNLSGKDASFNNITVQNQFLWGSLEVADIKVTHDISCSKVTTNQIITQDGSFNNVLYANDLCGNNFTCNNLEVIGLLKNDNFELPDDLTGRNLDLRGDLDLSGNFRVDGMIDISGHTTMTDISATNLELSGNFRVDGTADISSHTTMTDISATNLELSGNFKMNTSSNANLDISANGGNAQLYLWSSGSNTSYLTYNNELSIKLDGHGSVISCDDNGRVGIGTTNPSAKLEIYENSTSSVYSKLGNKNKYIMLGATSDANRIYSRSYANDASACPLWFNIGTDNTAAMAIDSSGNVGIGLTNPGAKLDVNGSFSAGEHSSSGGFEVIDNTNSHNIIKVPLVDTQNTSKLMVYRDIVYSSYGASSTRRNVIVLDTNIRKTNNVMYKIRIQGWSYSNNGGTMIDVIIKGYANNSNTNVYQPHASWITNTESPVCAYAAYRDDSGVLKLSFFIGAFGYQAQGTQPEKDTGQTGVYFAHGSVLVSEYQHMYGNDVDSYKNWETRLLTWADYDTEKTNYEKWSYCIDKQGLSMQTKDSDRGIVLQYMGTGGEGNGTAIKFRANDLTSGNPRSGTSKCMIKGAKENATHGDDASVLTFHTQVDDGNLTEQMRISSDGNVGIGTNNPSEALDVNGNITCNPALNLRQSTHTARVGRIESKFTDGTTHVNDKCCIDFYTGASDTFAMRINNGKVGIGKNNPGNKLDVDGGITCTSLNAGSGTIQTTGSITGASINATGGSISKSTTGYINGGLTSSTRTVTGTISVPGVYTDSVPSSYNVSSDHKHYINARNATHSLSITDYRLSFGSSGSVNNIDIYGDEVACKKLYIHSDKRLKTNISDVNTYSSLNKLLNLKMHKFTYINDGELGFRKEYGFIAQEIINVFPNCIKIGNIQEIKLNNETLKYTIQNDELIIINKEITNDLIDLSLNDILSPEIKLVLQHTEFKKYEFDLLKEEDFLEVNGNEDGEEYIKIRMPDIKTKENLKHLGDILKAKVKNPINGLEQSFELHIFFFDINERDEDNYIICREPPININNDMELFLKISVNSLTLTKIIKEIVPITEGIHDGLFKLIFKNKLTSINENGINYYIDKNDLHGGSIDNQKYLDVNGNNVIYPGKKLKEINKIVKTEAYIHKPLSIDYQRVFCLNIAATQEHNKMITNNEKEIETLKTENESLKTEVASLKSTLDSVLARLSALEGN